LGGVGVMGFIKAHLDDILDFENTEFEGFSKSGFWIKFELCFIDLWIPITNIYGCLMHTSFFMSLLTFYVA